MPLIVEGCRLSHVPLLHTSRDWTNIGLCVIFSTDGRTSCSAGCCNPPAGAVLWKCLATAATVSYFDSGLSGRWDTGPRFESQLWRGMCTQRVPRSVKYLRSQACRHNVCSLLAVWPCKFSGYASPWLRSRSGDRLSSLPLQNVHGISNRPRPFPSVSSTVGNIAVSLPTTLRSTVSPPCLPLKCEASPLPWQQTCVHFVLIHIVLSIEYSLHIRKKRVSLFCVAMETQQWRQETPDWLEVLFATGSVG
jgi:hypothetical protein